MTVPETFETLERAHRCQAKLNGWAVPFLTIVPEEYKYEPEPDSATQRTIQIHKDGKWWSFRLTKEV